MRAGQCLSLLILLAGCTAAPDEVEQRSVSRNSFEANESAVVKAAREACKHLREPFGKEEEAEVGISNYKVCLGDQANLYRPADRELCDLASSTMSNNGTCILAE